MSNDFTFAVNNGDITLQGKVDRFTVEHLLKGIDIGKISCEQLNIDFSAVERVDTAGLAWILKIMGQARQAGQIVKLNDLPPQLLKLSRTSGVEKLLSNDQ